MGGFFITLFQMADGQISNKIVTTRYKIFLTMAIIEIIAASSIFIIN
jgi:hypothetical protein